ncbi:MAG: hypothetical protein M1144_03260 [Candidatus Thermoplasmatota archaeon]|nr:hypothetical protein [Candidatus Thermoplasmatota archaeon]MCL5984919.1 hypothetical protein [Candidatus Thermoplasmatota archaeon]
MTLTLDQRVFSSQDERLQHCLCCERALVTLPNDRRGGYCFDCLSLEDSGRDTCPECHSVLQAENHHSTCYLCGWTAHNCWRA